MAASRPDLYRAYNRPALSPFSKSVKVNVLDGNGNLITTGPDSSIFLSLTVSMQHNFDSQPSAQIAQIYANNISGMGQTDQWGQVNLFLTHNAANQQQVYTAPLTVWNKKKIIVQYKSIP